MGQQAKAARGKCGVDTGDEQSNNPAMSRRDAVRRTKSYSSATGYVYQYQFQEVNRTRRGWSAGTEYVYWVSADRRTMIPLKIFVKGAAVEAWGRRAGRALSGTEEYAVAKMRLFQAFDEVEGLAAQAARQDIELVVDETNLEPLLALLDV